MNTLKEYAAALKLYREKNFDAALKILRDVQAVFPQWKKSFLLEAYIHRNRHEYFKGKIIC